MAFSASSRSVVLSVTLGIDSMRDSLKSFPVVSPLGSSVSCCIRCFVALSFSVDSLIFPCGNLRNQRLRNFFQTQTARATESLVCRILTTTIGTEHTGSEVWLLTNKVYDSSRFHNTAPLILFSASTAPLRIKANVPIDPKGLLGKSYRFILLTIWEGTHFAPERPQQRATE